MEALPVYGSIFRMKPKPGEEEAVLEMTDRFWAQRARQVRGANASCILRTSNGEMIGVAVFEDEQSYRTNASDPEQDKWYQELRSHLQADPEWNDGEITTWGSI